MPERAGGAAVPCGAPAVAPAPGARSLGALAREVARRLEPGLGAGAEREARELLAALHDRPRHWVTLERESAVDEAAWARALGAAARRAQGAPLAYAVGRAAFRHLTLEVDDRVLIPRPETEQLVEIALSWTAQEGGASGRRSADARTEGGGVAVDVGTGSGAIALALASEGRFDRVVATDVSRGALRVAARNAARQGGALRSAIDFRHGSLLAPVGESGVRLVVSNPPYIADDDAAALPRAVRDWEPPVALLGGGGDGLRITARLVRESARVLAPGGILAFEGDARWIARAAEHVASQGAYTAVRVLQDLTGRERFVVARRREEG